MKRSIHIHLDALPPCSSKTMGEAIALSSPNGSMSKAARERAVKRLGTELFGPGGLQQGEVAQPGKKDALLRQAKELRDLAARGMSPRKHIAEAERLEAEAKTHDAREILVYGLAKGATERWQEELLSSRCKTPADVEAVKNAARRDGYHSFRVTTYNGEPPDFTKVIK